MPATVGGCSGSSSGNSDGEDDGDGDDGDGVQRYSLVWLLVGKADRTLRPPPPLAGAGAGGKNKNKNKGTYKSTSER